MEVANSTNGDSIPFNTSKVVVLNYTCCALHMIATKKRQEIHRLCYILVLYGNVGAGESGHFSIYIKFEIRYMCWICVCT